MQQKISYRIIKSDVRIVKDYQKYKNSENRINQSNSVIGIKLLMSQSDPIKRRPLYIKTSLQKVHTTVSVG